MFVSDLRHFLDMPEDAPRPAWAMAAQLFDLVRAATAGDPDIAWVSGLTCRRRPGNRPCRGYMVVARPDSRPESIEWCCERCGDQGVIGGWEDSPFDLRSSDTGASDAELTKSFVVGDDVAAALRDLQLLDRECERLVYRMVGSADGAVLTIDAEDLDELLGFVAAEANHEEDRRRRKRLDGAFLVLQGALDSFPGDGPCWPWVRRARLRASGGLSRWSFGTELPWTWSNQPSSTSLPTGQASCGSSRLEDGLTFGSMRAGGWTSPGMVSTRATRSTDAAGQSPMGTAH